MRKPEKRERNIEREQNLSRVLMEELEGTLVGNVQTAFRVVEEKTLLWLQSSRQHCSLYQIDSSLERVNQNKRMRVKSLLIFLLTCQLHSLNCWQAVSPEAPLRKTSSPSSSTSSKSINKKRLTLHAAGFFPVSSKIPEGAIGRGVIPAVELALEHINDSPKILRGIHLDLVWNDTEVSWTFFYTFCRVMSCLLSFTMRVKRFCGSSASQWLNFRISAPPLFFL